MSHSNEAPLTHNDDPTEVMSPELQEAYRTIHEAHDWALSTGVPYAANSDELQTPDIQQHGIWRDGPRQRESYQTTTSRIQYNDWARFALAEIKPGVVVPQELAPEGSLEAEIITAINTKSRPVTTLGFKIFDEIDGSVGVAVDGLIYNESSEVAASNGVLPVQLLPHPERVYSDEEFAKLRAEDPETAAQLDPKETRMVYPESELLGRRLTVEEQRRATVFIAQVAAQEITRAAALRAVSIGQQALAILNGEKA